MTTVNKGFFSGRLCRDPELRYTSSGRAVCNITLAQDTKYKDADGNWVQGNTVFLDVAIWGKRGEAFSRFHKKGDAALVEYRLRLDQWEDEGRKRSKLKADCLDWHFAMSERKTSIPDEVADDTLF